MLRKSLVFWLLIAAATYIPPAKATPNLLTNPGFETGTTDGWTVSAGTISVSTDQMHSGSYSGIVTGRTAMWDTVQHDIMGLIDNGQTVTISAWVKLENAPTAFAVLLVQQTDDSGTNFQFLSWTMAYDDSWAYLTGDFTLNVTGTLSGLSLVILGPDAGVDFCVDDAELIGPDLDPSHAAGLVNAKLRRQQIEGFGAAGAWYENWLAAHPRRNEIYDILFRQLDLDIYRVRNTYGLTGGADYMNNTAKIIAGGEASLGRPLKILISSWSPPAYLKSNNNVAGGTLVKDANGNYSYGQFAEWWADSLDAFASYGIEADYVSMQNEPDYSASWDSCRFEPYETPDVAGYNQAFEALYNELHTRPDCPKLLAPEAIGMFSSAGYINALIDDSHVYGYAHHLYGDGSYDDPDGYRASMINFGSRYGDKPLMQTEFAKGDSTTITFTDAINLALLMHNSLALEGASAYVYWELFWAKPKGLVGLDNPWNSSPSYQINPVYYAFKHYSAFVHPGWQRVDASADSRNPRISAYISPDNNEMAVVLINPYPHTDISFDLSFNNFFVTDGNVYQTTSTQNCALVGDYNDSAPLNIPARSITTLALRGRVNTPPVAVAGPDRTAYAGINGCADVILDGSGSYDDDGDALEYHWHWTIDGNNYEANSVSPTIRLPIGEHKIELTVDDGFDLSEPADCDVTVIAPLGASVSCTPSAVNRMSSGWLTAMISMPADIGESDINLAEPLVFYPGQIKSVRQLVYEGEGRSHGQVCVWVLFDRSQCTQNLVPGVNEVHVLGKLTSGRYYDAVGSVKVVPATLRAKGVYPP
jgi:glucuronoarabinoxylan endo-1,4-beta-xylanase